MGLEGIVSKHKGPHYMWGRAPNCWREDWGATKTMAREGAIPAPCAAKICRMGADAG